MSEGRGSHGGEPGRERATRWRCGRFDLALDRTLVMGILNVTPDSFSDGGRFVAGEASGDAPAAGAESRGGGSMEAVDVEAAVGAGLAMEAAGAAILDVGGESTRPGAAEVSVEEELERTVPVVRGLAERARVPVSIDTRHAEVARACIEAGASIVNDVSGFRDPGMVRLAARGGVEARAGRGRGDSRPAGAGEVGCVVMHMLGEPGTMQDEPRYEDVVREVGECLERQAAALEDAGVARERICVDPGIGFGKTTAHNLALLRHVDELVATGRPVMVGASRKRFIGELTAVEEASERVAGSLGVASWCVSRGVQVLRVHDVAETVQAVGMVEAIRAGIPASPVGADVEWVPLTCVGGTMTLDGFVPGLSGPDAGNVGLDLLFAESVLREEGLACAFQPHRPFEGHDPYGLPGPVVLMVPESLAARADRLVREALRARVLEEEAAEGPVGEAHEGRDRGAGDVREESDDDA